MSKRVPIKVASASSFNFIKVYIELQRLKAAVHDEERRIAESRSASRFKRKRNSQTLRDVR